MKQLRLLSLLFLLLLFSGGYYFHTQEIITSITYGLIIGLYGYLVFDLVLAKGDLHKRITSVKLSTIYLFLLVIMNYLSSNHTLLFIELLLTVTYITIMLYINQEQVEVYKIDKHNTVPKTYLKKAPFKVLLETIFRLFPSPVPIGFYKVGNPSDTSPIYVTGNFDLTVRKVIKTIKNKDCYLLVCDSRGINIWCSSLSNHFHTEKIIDAIILFNVQDNTKNRQLILPQLSASNINKNKIDQEIGFKSTFGPVDIKDIDSVDKEIRQATFPIKNRIEMGVGAPIILSVLLIFIYNFIGLKDLVIILPIIYLLSILHAMIFPYRQIKNIPLWSILCGIILFITAYYLPILSFRIKITLSLGMIYLINEFSGWSPLIKYSLIPYKKPHITIDEDKCIACRDCIKVCPKAVYEVKEKAVVKNEDACILCQSCIKQCKTGAIEFK